MDIMIQLIVSVLKYLFLVIVALIGLFVVMFCLYMLTKAISAGYFSARKRYYNQLKEGESKHEH